jgi:poly(A) polymerase
MAWPGLGNEAGMTILPDSEWRQSSGLKRVVAALKQNGIAPRIVGGAVRDCLLDHVVSDVDLATPLKPDEVIKRLEAAGIKAVPTGIDHGTITAVADDSVFEITTLRRDVSTDGRRATVAFSDDWKEDAARRDFTINALYADPESGEIYDYFGGLADLENRRVRFIGNADQRIAEDHLRILRYFRFLARFGGGGADSEALAACAAGAAKMMALSRERIASELIKILSLPDPLAAVLLMIENGIFAPFLPELDRDASANISKLIVREKALGHQTKPTTRLIALLPADAAVADKVAMRMKFSRRMRLEIATCLKGQNIAPLLMRAFAYENNTGAARDAALLFAPDADAPDCMAILDDWRAPEFPVKGGHIIRLGLTAGPAVAQTLRDIELAWIGEDFPGEPRLDELTNQLVEEALLAAKKA